MKDNSIIIINKRKFKFNKFYRRLEALDEKSPVIACPKCKNTKFKISYGTYECIANCECGHSMTIYDG